MIKKIITPITKDIVLTLNAGDIVHISGYIYTARDAAHKKMIEDYEKFGYFPFDIENQVIYYCGPTPEKSSQVIGSAGPTTSYRMDSYSPFLLDNGITSMIGKGERSEEVINSMIKNKAVYFGATGGAGALLSSHIKSSKIIAYEELGAEAIRKIYVENFPLVVIIDCFGNNLYISQKAKYKK